MATATEIYIVRKMSTPLIISLVPEHLPAPVRDALEHLATARADVAAAEADLASTSGPDWNACNAKVTAAHEAAHEALVDFAKLTSASSTAIKDSGLAAFTQAMGSANEHVQAALDALADAAQAAALVHSVAPGKQVLRLDGREATEAPVRQQLAMARSSLRDVHSLLPDSVD